MEEKTLAQIQLENAQLQQQLSQSQINYNNSMAQYAGRPEDLEFNSQLGADGLINENLQLQNNVDTGFLEQMRSDNLRQPGEASAFRNLIDQQITRQAGDSQVSLQNAQNQNFDNLAMRGGAGAGARERMAQAGVGQNLSNQQNIFSNRLTADMEDEQNRMQGLRDLGEAETSYGNTQNAVDQQNRDATTQELFQQRAFDTNMYNEKMRAWASEQTASATPSSSGGKK